MKRILYLILMLLISLAAYSQTFSSKAKEYFINGNVKIARKDFTGAIEDFTRALKLDSNFKQAYENRGVAKFYIQDYQGSIDDYTKALEIDTNDYSTYGRRGWAKFYLHDYTGAIPDLDKAVSGSKDNFRYCNFRGQARFRLKDYDGAIDDFNLVIASWSAEKEQKSKALYWRGVTKIIIGQKESGCLDLRKAVKLGSVEAEIAIEQYCNN